MYRHLLMKLFMLKLRLPVCFLEPLQGQDEQLGVMFVGQGRERDGGEPPTLQPMNSGGVNGHRLFSCDIGAILQTEYLQSFTKILNLVVIRHVSEAISEW